MIELAQSSDERTLELLRNHPRVARVEPGSHSGVDFKVGVQQRSVYVADPSQEVAGLVELIDNNPMVCAESMSVADPTSTLALIALGPLAWAGMILEPPTVISSVPANPDLLERFLETAGWQGGVTYHYEQRELGTVRAVVAMAVISTPADWSEIDDVYEERYGRAFYVRRDDDSSWEPELVQNQPHAVYRVRYSPGDDTSLLTIQVLGDEHGKCGSAQTIHAMNVMAGFEESLGIH